jgi:hypothetical protein
MHIKPFYKSFKVKLIAVYFKSPYWEIAYNSIFHGFNLFWVGCSWKCRVEFKYCQVLEEILDFDFELPKVAFG